MYVAFFTVTLQLRDEEYGGGDSQREFQVIKVREEFHLQFLLAVETESRWRHDGHFFHTPSPYFFCWSFMNFLLLLFFVSTSSLLSIILSFSLYSSGLLAISVILPLCRCASIFNFDLRASGVLVKGAGPSVMDVPDPLRTRFLFRSLLPV